MKAQEEVGAIARTFASKGVDYLLVYITEAHPTDGWMNEWAPVEFGSTAHARSTEDRLSAARNFIRQLNLAVPILIDSIADELENRYEARPERLYVIKGNRVLWRCGLGPFEYDAPGLRAFLESQTASTA